MKIYLPRLYGEAAATEQAKRLATIHRGLRSEVILVVEDEERVRAVSVEALKGAGLRRRRGLVRRRRCACSTKGSRSPCCLPTSSCRTCPDDNWPIARGRKRPNLKVLYTTGYTRNAIVHNGMLDPGTNLLTKPFSIEELAAKGAQDPR